MRQEFLVLRARASILGRCMAGQGTVEYVALILLVAVILAGVVAATQAAHIGGSDIANAIVKQIKQALDKVT